MHLPRPLRVGIDPALEHSLEEIKYVFRTLLRVTGFSYEFVWANGSKLDIYYGRDAHSAGAHLNIEASGCRFEDAPQLTPIRLCGGHIDFGRGPDPILSSYWLLTGAAEPSYRTDRWHNLHLDGAFFIEQSLTSKPLVSLYASELRERFTALGCIPYELPWCRGGKHAAFAFSHDVDYPEIIRLIECLRLARERGTRAWRSITGVLRGTNHFWKFAEWVEFAGRFGSRPAFYFMARKGSLLQYALGTPDAFYDVRSPRFRELFQYLRDEGCEIGLHASYHAHRDAVQFRREKQLIEEQAAIRVAGNRHHYWHLDPTAPNDTLAMHEEVGLDYDTSLAFEFYPGYRRGICHPFRPYHPGSRRELSVVQLPPAWMDNHYDKRLEKNWIASSEEHAQGLVQLAKDTRGVVAVNYHARGMNADFYPRWGPWLAGFMRRCDGLAFATPAAIVESYKQYECVLERESRDMTERAPVPANSPVCVTEFENRDAAAWEDFVANHPAGNVYHSLAWKAITEEGLGHRPMYLKATGAGGSITGILPLFLVKGVTGKRLVSVPMRDRGGLLAADRVSARALLKRAVELSREFGCAYLELRSTEEFDRQLAGDFRMLVHKDWVTTRVDLSPGVERLWKALDRDAIRWAINKAGRSEVTIEPDYTPAGIDLFFSLFVRTRTRMGIPPFPRDLFMAIWRHLISKGRANLFVVRQRGVPIHAMINFLSKDTFIPAYAAPQNEWRKSYPNEFMFWHTIKWAAEQGFRFYDFGADSPHQTGLLQFKKKWGGVQRPVWYAYHLNGRTGPPNFDSSTRVYTLLRDVWRRLPLPVSQRLGAWVTTQIS